MRDIHYVWYLNGECVIYIMFNMEPGVTVTCVSFHEWFLWFYICKVKKKIHNKLCVEGKE